jgi:hypothetical protein
MRTRTLPAVIALVSAALHLGAAPLGAQTVRGKLIEQITNKPVADAAVSLVAMPDRKIAAETKSDGGGRFSVKAPAPGVYRLRALLKGYRTAVSPAISLKKGDELEFTWPIFPDTIYLTPISVTATPASATARMSGFSDRMKSHAGAGRFITRDEIEKRRPFRVSDLLVTIPGLQLRPGRLFDNVVTTEGCRPEVYLDGVRYPLLGESIDQIVNPMELEAVEVYPHLVDVPPQFHSIDSNCGAIVLWTRVGR